MTPEESAALREPFPAESIGKKPTITCKACSADRDRRHCDKHKMKKCRTCGNYLTEAHDHLDFVGHAYVRERLLNVDIHWNWKPMGVDELGRPAFDADGGMWIYLTICGEERIGYGDADGKKGGKAKKEAIGDALRNAGQSFGIALDQWKKDAKLVGAEQPTETGEPSATERTPTLVERVKELRGQCLAIWRARGGDAASLTDEYAGWSSGPDDPKGRDLATEIDPNILYQFQRHLQKQATP